MTRGIIGRMSKNNHEARVKRIAAEVRPDPDKQHGHRPRANGKPKRGFGPGSKK